jgi:hypothetical protein
VHAGDIIAEAEIYNEILTVELARGLGVTEFKTDDCLVRQVGEHLAEGDIIAQIEGTFPRLVRSPVGGKLLECYDGKAVLAVGKQKINQKAQMIGCVESVIPEYGVNILAIGSLVQGVWGNGLIGEGLLYVFTRVDNADMDDAIDQLDTNQVLVIDGCLDEDLLKKVSEKQISGLVCTTIMPELIPSLASLPMPVISLNGFGHNCPVDPSLEWFWQKNGALACVNASKVDVISAQRPEIIIPTALGEPVNTLNSQEKLAPGQKVKIIAGKYQGRSGALLSLPGWDHDYEGCQQKYTAEVELVEGDVVPVLHWNLMIINE